MVPNEVPSRGSLAGTLVLALILAVPLSSQEAPPQEQAGTVAAPAGQNGEPTPAQVAETGGADGEAAADAEQKERSPTEELFARKCASCHTIGDGPRVGPDLKGVHTKRERAWIERMIQEPSSLLASDPTARKLLAEFNNVKMPDLGLAPEQASSLADLIERCSSEPCDLAPEMRPVTQATEDDIALGRRLFLGREALSEGGPPCLSCHTVRGAGGFVPGGTLSKDLTHAFARLGDQGLDAALASPPFKLMNKIYAAKPLSSDEAFALRAFLYEANRSEPEADDHWSLASVGFLGAVAAMLILNAFWRRRLRGVRRLYTHANGETP